MRRVHYEKEQNSEGQVQVKTAYTDICKRVTLMYILRLTTRSEQIYLIEKGEGKNY